MQVVLIGHSMGGLSCMLLTEQFSHKIGLVIYVAAILIPSGASVMGSGVLTEFVLQSLFLRSLLAGHLLVMVTEN